MFSPSPSPSSSSSPSSSPPPEDRQDSASEATERRCNMPRWLGPLLSFAVGWLVAWAISSHHHPRPADNEMPQLPPVISELAPWNELRAHAENYKQAMTPLYLIHQVSAGNDTTEPLWVPAVLEQLIYEVDVELCGVSTEHLDDPRLSVTCEDLTRSLDEMIFIIRGVSFNTEPGLWDMLFSTKMILWLFHHFREDIVASPSYACSREARDYILGVMDRKTREWPNTAFVEKHYRLISLMGHVKQGLATLLRIYALVADCPYQKSNKEDNVYMEDICISLQLMYAVHLPRLDHVDDILSARQPHVTEAQSHWTAFAQSLQEKMDKDYRISEDTQDCLDAKFTGDATLAEESHTRHWMRLMDEAEAHLVPLWNFLEIQYQERSTSARIPSEFRALRLQDSRPRHVRSRRQWLKGPRCRWFTPPSMRKFCISYEQANEKIDDWDFTISPGCTVTTVTMASGNPKLDALWYGETKRTTEQRTGQTIPARTTATRTMT